jgi:hypothetical protein
MSAYRPSKLPTVTKAQCASILSILQQIDQLVSGASSLISCGKHPDSLVEIESAANANSN